MKLLAKIAPLVLAQLGNYMTKIFKFEITEEEANTILTGLQELPAKLSNPVSKKLIEQAKAQITGRVIEHEIDETVKTAEQFG